VPEIILVKTVAFKTMLGRLKLSHQLGMLLGVTKPLSENGL
jgi:hypothetical protein